MTSRLLLRARPLLVSSCLTIGSLTYHQQERQHNQHHRSNLSPALCEEALARPVVISRKLQQADGLHDDAPNNPYIAYLRRALGTSLRLAEMCERVAVYLLLGVPAALLALPAYLLGGYLPFVRDIFWMYSIWSIEMLGPAFVKMAQWASTRPDLYPRQLTERLERLQDNVTANYSMRTVENTLTSAFGEGWREQLRLEPEPIGAGCIAQVYKGVLLPQSTSQTTTTRAHDAANGNNNNSTHVHNSSSNHNNSTNNGSKEGGGGGEEVAVKVLHPNIERKVRLDMQLLAALADLLDAFPRLEMLSLGDTCRQFVEVMRDQLDLSIEAANLRIFADRFAKDAWAVFPRPIEGLVSKNVLVETFMEGTPIKEFARLPDDDPRALALKLKLSDLGVRSVLKMVFFDNFIHGDLHPGNLLVHFRPSGEPQLVFLDCGIVYTQPTERDHDALVGVCLAFMNRDGRRAARLMIDNARDKSGHVVREEEAFCTGIQEMVDEALDKNYFEHIGDYVSRICELAYLHKVKLDPSYFRVAMALKVVEGISLGLNKELDMVSKCVPIIVQTQTMRKLGFYKFPTPTTSTSNSTPTR